jgi:serine/threonine protein kinase
MNAGVVVLERFEVLGEIGRGGQGIVYRGRERSGAARPVAIKVGARAAIGREAAILRSLPRTPAVAGHVADAPGVLVTEFIDGETVAWFAARPVLAGHPFPELALLFARGICEALEALHACGYVHGDLQQVNVIVARDRMVLCDLARAARVQREDEQCGEVASAAAWALNIMRSGTFNAPVDPRASNPLVGDHVAEFLFDWFARRPAARQACSAIDALLGEVGIEDPRSELQALLQDPHAHRERFAIRAAAALERSSAARARRGRRACDALAMWASHAADTAQALRAALGAAADEMANVA